MMYMPDALRAAMELMDAPADSLKHRNAFNLAAEPVTPAALADAIKTHIPQFEIDYDVDPVRQKIADSWPKRVDDSAAREEWGWRHEYDTAAMVADMLAQLAPRLGVASPVG
jgi:nucleoside-diphosphate-sugar epimerase